MASEAVSKLMIHRQVEGWQDFFANGVKRDAGVLQAQPHGAVLNLGSGYAPIPLGHEGDANLDRPYWEAPILPSENGTVAAVHMYHFLEHLPPEDAMSMLIEVERVLMPGGVCYIVVPHAMCPLAYQAPDHKSYWTEEGFQDTFYSQGYDSSYGHHWKLDIAFMTVAGVKWSNLCVFVQLIKQRIDEESKWWIPFDTPWRRS